MRYINFQIDRPVSNAILGKYIPVHILGKTYWMLVHSITVHYTEHTELSGELFNTPLNSKIYHIDN